MLVQGELYGRPDYLRVLHDFVCPEAHDLPAFAFHVGSAACIGLLPESVVLNMSSS